MSVLPIDAVLPELLAALRAEPNVVLSAEPGAGKTTRVPLALMADAAFAPGKILMLEPRRLAAIRAAEYMASQLGEGSRLATAFAANQRFLLRPASRWSPKAF